MDIFTSNGAEPLSPLRVPYCGCAAIIAGLWFLNAPRWMWLVILAWWLALILAAVLFQRAGRTIDNYQAIWGPDPRHPDKNSKPIGFGVNRHQK